jgi:tetratricopeptide (TPR) repeat protein
MRLAGSERAGAGTAGFLGLLLLCGGCVPAGVRLPVAADVPRLEAALRADPAAIGTRQQLAVAYREAGQPERAIELLEPLVRTEATDPAAALYLGLSYEEAGRLAEARSLYEKCLTLPLAAPVRDRIEMRLDLLGRLELRAAVRATAASEQAAAQRPPVPGTVGVFPFLLTARDTALRPLGRALAELLTTDLAQTDRLRVLERVQLQLLADEIRLGERGVVDPATAARAGRLLSAAHVVQGRIAGSAAALEIETLVLATTAEARAGAPLRQEGVLARVFDIEKEIALATYERLGIQLTAAERQRVNQRQTENVQALLAFGFGLEAQDAGRYREAAQHFARAAQLDPGFARARRLREEAEAWDAAGGPRELARLASSHFDLRLTPWQRQRLTPESLEAVLPPILPRDITVEVLGTEGLDRGASLELIIRRPTGSGSR